MRTGVRLAIDVGSVRIGVARCYRDGGLASPLTTVPRGRGDLDTIAGLDAAYPGLAGRILDDNGQLRRFVNVYVGEEDVRFAQGLDTQVSAGTRVSFIPAVAGGAS